MGGIWTGLASKPETIGVAVAALVVLTLFGLGVRMYVKQRPTPAELERRRRRTIQENGKIGDGEILDIDAESIVYSYSVAGVAYTASQDLSALQSLLPRNPVTLTGVVSVKFDPRNPANSIVLCEDWSGLRNRV